MSDVVAINTISGGEGRLKYCECILEDQSISLLVDVGARVSVINDTYSRYFSTVPLVSSPLRLSGYGGGRIGALGVVRLNVRFKHVSLQQFSFHVTKSGSNLMGVDLFDALWFKVEFPGVTPSRVAGSTPLLEVSTDTPATALWQSLFPNVFTGLGCAKKFVHCPMIDPSVLPVSRSLRRLPVAIRLAVSKKLLRLESEDVIERIDASPWISNLVVRTKKSGDLRVCVGLVAVNRAIVPGKHPLPTLEELAAEFNGATVYTKLDLKQGYLQIPLAPKARPLTAFVSHEGLPVQEDAVWTLICSQRVPESDGLALS